MTNLERELDELIERAKAGVMNAGSPLMLVCSPELSGVARTAVNESIKNLIAAKGLTEYDYIRLLAGNLDMVTTALHTMTSQRDLLLESFSEEAMDNGTLCNYCVHSDLEANEEPCHSCVDCEDDAGYFEFDFEAQDDPVDLLGE